jgi:hypothetical protein
MDWYTDIPHFVELLSVNLAFVGAAANAMAAQSALLADPILESGDGGLFWCTARIKT